MDIKMIFEGPVNVFQCSGDITVRIEAGGKVSTTSASQVQQQWCDSNIAPNLLAAKCRKIEAVPSGDWQRSFWGGNPKIFGGNAPSGLKKGDTLFYWKAGEHSAPEGWEVLWQDQNTCIIPIQLGDEDNSYLDTDDDAFSVRTPTEENHYDDDVEDEEDFL